MRSCKGYSGKKANSNKTCASMNTCWINDMVIMKITIETIPTRTTTYFQGEVCSRRKTDTYNYKRKWNKKVTSDSKTGKEQIFTIFHWWARSTGLFSFVFWFNSHYYDGSVFRCFVDSLCFWEIITGNNHLTSATRHCKKIYIAITRLQ